MTENYELGETREEATSKILDLLEECGSASKFIWFREIHRITDIDKGLLRNILNELKKSKEINVIHGDNKRIFYCLKKYYKKCYDARLKFKDKPIILKDGTPDDIIPTFERFMKAGVNHFVIRFWGKNYFGSIDKFASHVMPYLREKESK